MGRETVKADLSREVFGCNRCGFCMAGCPVYRVTGREWDAARGRVALLRLWVDGHLSLDELHETISTCLLCLGCLPHCPAGVRLDRVITLARQGRLEAGRRSWWQQVMFRGLLTSPHLLRWAGRVAPLMTGAGRRLLSIGAARRLLSGLARGIQLLPPRLGPAARSALLKRRTSSPQFYYFLGCASDLVFPGVVRATVRLLEQLGFQVVLSPRQVCCGLPAWAFGDQEAARRQALANMRALSELDIPVLSDCSSCTSTLRHYPDLWPQGTPERARAEAFASRVLELVSFLHQFRDRFRGSGSRKGAVTYHDPCHLSRYLQVREEPRALLRQLGGWEFREAAEADACCGGAGSYAVTQPDLSDRILERKIDALLRTGADVVATVCPACLMQLGYGLRRRGARMRAVHLVELLTRAATFP